MRTTKLEVELGLRRLSRRYQDTKAVFDSPICIRERRWSGGCCPFPFSFDCLGKPTKMQRCSITPGSRIDTKSSRRRRQDLPGIRYGSAVKVGSALVLVLTEVAGNSSSTQCATAQLWYIGQCGVQCRHTHCRRRFRYGNLLPHFICRSEILYLWWRKYRCTLQGRAVSGP